MTDCPTPRICLATNALDDAAAGDVTTTRGMALNTADGDQLPEWIQLTPKGPHMEGGDGRTSSLRDAAAFAERFNAAGQPAVIDIEHAAVTQDAGTAVPAQGWIEELSARDGVLWGRVSWTPPGAKLMRDKAYRYVSPAFYHATSGDREMATLHSVALTHRPNFCMLALNSETTRTEIQVDEAIRKALGRCEGATSANAVDAITKLQNEKALAVNSAQHPDPAKFVPKADYDLATNKIKAFEAEVAKQAEAAIEAGKIAPAAREYHLATCKAVGADKFAEMVATMPTLVGGGDKPAGKPGKGGGTPAGKYGLSDDELAMCKAMGSDPAAFATFKADDQADDQGVEA